MKKLKLFFHKQNLRRNVGQFASYVEIFVAFVIVIGIVLFLIRTLLDFKFIVHSLIDVNIPTPPLSDFLTIVFELIISIEFVKMLVKHTPASAIEVLLYTIARKLIADHGSMIEALLAVVSIGILFAIRKYLNDDSIHNYDYEGELIVNGGTSLAELNRRIGSDFDEMQASTVAGFICNFLKLKNTTPNIGEEVVIGDYTFQIYEMDEHLIRHVKIFTHSH